MLSEVCGNFFPPDFGLVIVMQQGNSLWVNESMPSIKYPSVQILFTDTWSLALYFLEVHVLVQMLFQCCEHTSPSPTWAVCSRFQALCIIDSSFDSFSLNLCPLISWICCNDECPHLSTQPMPLVILHITHSLSASPASEKNKLDLQSFSSVKYSIPG